VHAERPADPPDHHEQVDELRLGREQLGELVEHDEQRRQRRQPGAALPVPLVVAQRGVVAGGAQQFLAPDDLTVQGVPHPVDERQFLLEVGDDRGDVVEPLQPEEGRAALEVDEDEVEDLRGMGQRQAKDQGPEQLRLARAGGPDDQAVRPHAALRGLLDVQFDRLPPGVQPDRHPQPVPRRPGAPQAARPERFRVVDAEQRGERGVHRQRVLTGQGPAQRAHRRELAGERLRLRDREPVGDADP